MATRSEILNRLASIIAGVRRAHPVRVAVDGVDAVGKTTLANELASIIETPGRPVIRAGIDGFHNPRAIRYRSGADSPEGYFKDSFDYDAIRRRLLAPLGPDGTLEYVTAIFDYRADREVSLPVLSAPADAVLLFDGVFLLRPELEGAWDLTIWVDAPFEITVARAERRAHEDGSGAEGLRDRYRRRYVPGQRLYMSECRPRERADLVLENGDLAAPRLIDQRRRPARRTASE